MTTKDNSQPERTQNSWIDDLDSDIVNDYGEKPGYFDKDFPWPELDPSVLSGSAIFCDYVSSEEGNAQPKVKINKEMFLRGMWFNDPDDVHPKDFGRHVKGVKPDGTYIQVPMSPHINSGEAGSPTSGIYWARGKGFWVEWDEATKSSLFCLACNCFAKAMTPALVKKYPEHAKAAGTGYCSLNHAIKAEPAKFRNLAQEANPHLSLEEQMQIRKDLESMAAAGAL